jgi:Smg protein
MKENVLDVLMYLFETYVDTDEEPEADHNELRDELSRAGFADPEIDRALEWLDGLTEHQGGLAFNAQTSHGTRIYNDFEQERLDASCRVESADIDVEQIKWVVLMVLFSQPGQELAYARMEDLVFEESTGSIH